jgi:hypothetical protein
MIESIELRRLKPTLSYPRSVILTSNEILSDSSDDESFQTLPMIINTQPIQYRKHEVLVRPPPIQYVPSTVVENKPFVYQRVYTPTLIEDRTFAYYRSCETPVRRLVKVQPSNEKNVHLPKHSKKLVNRFLDNLEQAHEHQVSLRKKISFFVILKYELISIRMEMRAIAVLMIVMFVVDFDQL